MQTTGKDRAHNQENKQIDQEASNIWTLETKLKT